MYAIVKTGGKQYKVAVDDVVTVEKIDGAPGDVISLVPVLLVDGDDLTTAADALASATVSSRSSSTPRARRSASTSSRTRPGTTSVRGTVSR